MATVLDKPLIRETGLVNSEGKDVFIMLIPGEEGGVLAFREKGKGGKGFEISLKKVLEALTNGSTPEVKPVPMEGAEECVDLVDLSILEPRLMVQAESVMTSEAKAILWEIIREIREERREDMALPSLGHGSKRNKPKRDAESVRI
jgi:hypothetical protein